MKKNKGLIAILIIVVIIVTLGLLYITGVIDFGKRQAVNDDETGSELIKNKIIRGLNCGNSNESFNGISVNVEQTNNDGTTVCTLEKVMVNGMNITSDIPYEIKDYAFYDDNLIILSKSSSGSLLVIYNVTNNSIVMELSPDTFDGYFVDDFDINNDSIMVKVHDCGEQCNKTPKDNPKKKLDILYKNNKFINPLINESSSISYEIKGDSTKNSLYINGKEFDKISFDMYDESNIYQIGDLLLVGVCTSGCDEYFVNGDGEIVGKFSTTDMSGVNDFITPKYANFTIAKVEGNDIYVTSYKYTHQDGSSICKYNNDEEVRVTEMFTYQGNNDFTSGKVTESLTKNQVMEQDQRFVCQ